MTSMPQYLFLSALHGPCRVHSDLVNGNCWDRWDMTRAVSVPEVEEFQGDGEGRDGLMLLMQDGDKQVRWGDVEV